MELETISVLLALPPDELSPHLLRELGGAGLRIEHLEDLTRLGDRVMAGGDHVAAIDVVLLDRPWFEHLASWRLQGMIMPVIFILAPDHDLEPSPELVLGRYDFLAKPVRAGELAVRARSAHAPEGRTAADTLQHGDLILRLIAKEVLIAGEPVELTALEFRMLRYFMMRQRHVISQADLSTHLYAPDEQQGSNTIEAYVSRLRRKIGASRIRTIRGMGYRFG